MTVRGTMDTSSKRPRFSLGLGVTIFAIVVVGIIVLFVLNFSVRAPETTVPPATLEQAEPELADAVTGTSAPETPSDVPETVEGLDTEVAFQPGAAVGMRFAPMQKSDDVPHATGTRMDIGGHVFYRRNMMWHQAGYDGTMGPSIEVGSDAAKALIAREPYLARAMKLGPIVAARVDGKWCFFHSVRSQ